MFYLLAIVECLIVAGTMNQTQRAPRGKTYSVNSSSELIRSASDALFVEVLWDEIPPKLRSHIHSHLDNRFAKGASPLGAPGAKTQVYAAMSPEDDDLFLHTWTRDGFEFRAIEGNAGVILEVRLAQFTEPVAQERGFANVRDLIVGQVENLLRLTGRGRDDQSHTLAIPWPSQFVSGTRFSSAPANDVNKTVDWRERVDIEVTATAIRIMMPNAIPDYAGFLNGAEWFPDDFRAFVHQRARGQGKLPPDTKE